MSGQGHTALDVDCPTCGRRRDELCDWEVSGKRVGRWHIERVAAARDLTREVNRRRRSPA